MDKWLNLERELGALASQQAADSRAFGARLDGFEHAVAKLDRDLKSQLHVIAEKLDEQRTRRPDLIAIGGLLLGIIVLGATMLGGMWTLLQAQMSPIERQIVSHEQYIDQMRSDRWTESDHIRYSDSMLRLVESLSENLKDEDAEIREHIERLSERLHEVETRP